MKKSTQASFITMRNRDASPTLRGYYFQIEQTVLRWLTLRPGQWLELERGEDIDRVSQAAVAQGEEQLRLLEQVKHRESRLTLLTPGALEALANCYEHRRANPTITLFFRYTTNAPIGHEKKGNFPDGMEGIRAWELLRQRRPPAARTRVLLQGIRETLIGATCPPKFSRATWDPFCAFIAGSSNDDLLRFIRAFEWSTRNETTPMLRVEIEQSLRCRYHIHDEETVRACYDRLFLTVFQTLTQRGEKILTVEQRTQLLANPAISASETRMLEWLKRTLDLRLAPIEQDIEALRQEMMRLTYQVEKGEQTDSPLGPPFDEGLLMLPGLFVGRDGDRAWLLERLSPASPLRILALRGMAGVGKTALAAWSIHYLLEQGAYPDGVAVIDCQGQSDALAVVARVLARFDPHRRSPQTRERAELSERAFHQLVGRQALVVFDSVEPALRLEEVVGPLKRTNVKILVTARHVLSHAAIPLSAQHEVPMLKESEALTLFYHAMGRADGNPLSPEGQAAGAKIVASLGFHPLAIRVAGAYAADLQRDLEAFAREMETLRVALELADGEVPQAVAAVLMQSVTALQKEEQRVFAALASFHSPEMGRNAAVALATALGIAHPTTVIDLLARRSLIGAFVNEQMRNESDRERLRMHVLVHALSDDLFVRWPEEERNEALAAVGRYYAIYVNATKEEALGFDEVPISASLDWAYQHDEVVIGVRICTGMRFFWRDRWRMDAYHSYLPWGALTATRIAQLTEAGADWLSAAHLGLTYGQVLQNLGDLEEADEVFHWCLPLFQKYGDRRAEGGVYHQLAQNARNGGRWDEAQRDLESSLAIAREYSDQQTEASCLGELSLIASLRGRWDLAERYCDHALSLLGPNHDQGIKGVLLMRRGQLAYLRGQTDIAQRYLQESIPLQRQAYGVGGEVASLGLLGQVALLDGRLEDANHFLQECLRIANSVGDRKAVALAQYGLGLVAAFQGEFDRAEELNQQAIQLTRQLQDHIQEVGYLLTGARIAWGRGRLDEAEERYRQSVQLAKERGLFFFPQASTEFAQFLSACGRQEEATQLLAQISEPAFKENDS